MARKKRVNLAGFYHIINRGVEKRDVFLKKEDFEWFLEICEEYSKIFNFEIYSFFCLMKNHYHLLIKTTENNISQIMKHKIQNKGSGLYFLIVKTIKEKVYRKKQINLE